MSKLGPSHVNVLTELLVCQRNTWCVTVFNIRFVANADQVVVNVRVIFLKIGEIDTVKETYSAEVYIQASWREPLFDGKTDTVSVNVPLGEFAQARVRQGVGLCTSG